MQLFGYVCSPLCKEKAELQGIELPQFAGQRDAVERKKWRKIGMVAGTVAAIILALIGVWAWYEWFGSRPRPAFAIRFENEPAMSGESAVCDGNQLVFIHGDKLARYDMKSKKEVWLKHIVDKQKIADTAARIVKEAEERKLKSNGDFVIRVPSLEKLIKEMTRATQEGLKLYVSGQNLWVSSEGTMTRYDWGTGEKKEEVEFHTGYSGSRRQGDEIESRRESGMGGMAISRFNLTTGKIRTEEIGETLKPVLVSVTDAGAVSKSGKTNKPVRITPAAATALAKASANRDAPQDLDPQKMAEALSKASYAAKIAAPATISVAMNQQRALKEMADMDSDFSPPPGVSQENAYKYQPRTRLVATKDGFIQFTTTLLEEKIVERSAMKAAPKKSALDGPVNAANSMDIANELLNEIQRTGGGDTVREDMSRYLVRVHVSGQDDWTGESEGEATIHSQQTVIVVACGKKLIVLDKSNKKKWETILNYPLGRSGSSEGFEASDGKNRGLGPVVERGDTLYIFDQGVLGAFDVASGAARWRLPSVGISGMYFDDEGMIYINTTTASPEAIKYSKQIDLSSRTDDIVVKLDPKTGKEIWKHSMGGVIAYFSGKFIYTMTYTGPLDEGEELSPEMVAMGVEVKPYIRIRRISPKNGKVMWDYYQARGPLDVKIHDNTFQVVFKKEVQVLKFLTF